MQSIRENLTPDRIIGIAQVLVAFLLGVWASLHPVLQALVVAQVLDIFSGLVVGFTGKKLASDVAWRGISKKVMVWFIVALASVVSPYVGGLPLATIVASYYLAHEGLSIVENASEAGLPIPSALENALEKISDQPDGGRER